MDKFEAHEGYLSWDQATITDLSPANVARMYDRGYVFTRKGKGVMQQTRSVRIDLSKFELSSENRRILKKTDPLKLAPMTLPLIEYTYTIGKLAKDFYAEKFGTGIMSAQKIKEMLTDPNRSNFNILLTYATELSESPLAGYAICHSNNSLLHYSYPFYNLGTSPKDMGLGMMIKSIQWAKGVGRKYIYLGSIQNKAGLYKLQFTGLEWFDGGPNGSGKWSTNLEAAKKVLAEKIAPGTGTSGRADEK